MLLAVLALVVAVVAYGWSGLALAAGSRAEGGALGARDWWVGTGLQGVGFLTSLVARTVLPLLLVQSAIAGALAVTAALEHVTGVRRLGRAEALAVLATVAGIGAVATAVLPGPTRAATVGDVAVLAVLLACCAVATPRVRSALPLGVLSGTAFGSGAVGARLLVGTGAPLTESLRFWTWSPLAWAVALVMPLGIVIGQWALTRGLARGASVTALSGDYLLATIVPSAFGVGLLGEHTRDGLLPLAAVGLLLALWGTRRLLRASV